MRLVVSGAAMREEEEKMTSPMRARSLCSSNW